MMTTYILLLALLTFLFATSLPVQATSLATSHRVSSHLSNLLNRHLPSPPSSHSPPPLSVLPSPPNINILSVSGCPRQFHNYTIDCGGGERLVIQATNFGWFDSIILYSTRSGNQYHCNSIGVIDDYTITCIAPPITQTDVGTIFVMILHDQIYQASVKIEAVEYNRSRSVEASLLPSASNSPSSLPFPLPPSTAAVPNITVVSVSGCRPFRNWTVECGGGETILIKAERFGWIDSILFISPDTGKQYPCSNIQPVDDSTVSCTAPRITSNDVGVMLMIYMHDEVNNVYIKSYGIEYNRTSPTSSLQSRSVSAAPPVILSVSGCARQFRNWTIDCGGGEVISIKISNFQWIDSVNLFSNRTGRQYMCNNIHVINESTVQCTLPRVTPSDYATLIQLRVHDQVLDILIEGWGVVYNRSSSMERPVALPSPTLVTANTTTPVIVNVSGCARQFRNWTVDCGGEETIVIAVQNLGWFDTVNLLSLRTGDVYGCTNIQPVDDSTLSCTAPRVRSNVFGELLMIQAHDEMKNAWVTGFGVEFNRTNPTIADMAPSPSCGTPYSSEQQ
jgi:hypothetical protein